MDQLHLFPRVAALHELVDVRDDIERDLVIEEARRDGFATGPGECLLPQLVHAADARPRHGLVAGGDHARESAGVVERLERHDGDNGRAVGTGHDTLVTAEGVGIDLWHHEGDRGVHPEGAGLVDHDRARLDRVRRVLPGLGRARREECDVDALEGLGSYLLHSNRLALEGDALAHRPLGGEGAELLHGKLALVENLERGLSHGSRHPDYGNR